MGEEELAPEPARSPLALQAAGETLGEGAEGLVGGEVGPGG